MPSIRHWEIGAVSALAAMLAFQAAGWFLTWGILQFEAKSAAHFAINRRETSVQTTTIPTALFLKICVGKKEIRLEGRLYDIVSQKVSGDSITLALYHDRHEEALFDAISGLLWLSESPNTAHLPPMQSWLAKWLGAAFLMPELPSVAVRQAAFSQHHFTCLLPVAQTAPGCFSPPPEGVFVRRILAA